MKSNVKLNVKLKVNLNVKPNVKLNVKFNLNLNVFFNVKCNVNIIMHAKASFFEVKRMIYHFSTSKEGCGGYKGGGGRFGARTTKMHAKASFFEVKTNDLPF